MLGLSVGPVVGLMLGEDVVGVSVGVFVGLIDGDPVDVAVVEAVVEAVLVAVVESVDVAVEDADVVAVEVCVVVSSWKVMLGPYSTTASKKKSLSINKTCNPKERLGSITLMSMLYP